MLNEYYYIYVLKSQRDIKSYVGFTSDLMQRFDRVEESQGGSSKSEFGNKVRIAVREMRESNYWLRIIKRNVPGVNISENNYLVSESSGLLNILGSIAQKFR